MPIQVVDSLIQKHYMWKMSEPSVPYLTSMKQFDILPPSQRSLTVGVCQRGHVYRMFNFCLALHSRTEEEKTQLAIAACFHDLGLWSAHTVDYIPPSVFEVKRYLSETGRQEWSEEIGLMVEMHHKVRTYKTDRYPLVELFRRGDLVDFSLAFFKFGIPCAYVSEVKKAIPNNGFHRFLIKGAREWFAKHPFSPPPFIKW